ncbi:MAG: hypothetical protein AB1599_01145 [Planctomycetota bacterium]
MKTANARNKCKKYEMAINDYALGQDIQMSKDELFGHLSACGKCQKYAREARATVSVLRAKEYDSTPEAKKHFEEFMAKLHASPTCRVTPHGEKILNAEWEFGSTAGLVYNYLKKFPDHKARIDDMVKEIGFASSISGMSWLTNEKKLGLSLSGKDAYAFLRRNNQ